MLTILRDGHAYRSKAALERVRSLTTADRPHVTPDGHAVLACDLRGRVTVRPIISHGDPGDPAIVAGTEEPVVTPVLVVLADHGHDLMHLTRDEAGSPAIRRVELVPEDLPDLEPLREYDHLPESRKDYDIYPKGHKLT